MSHGYIHQGNQKYKGPDGPALHLLQMLLHRRQTGSLLLRLGFPRRLFSALDRGAVACVFHSLDDSLDLEPAAVKFYLHTVGQ